jgi:glycosyltransferase involved in cell wall biosynthesis
MSSRLSVCLLIQNEERNIERTIRSVEGVADEVVVADTGSADRTEQIARGLGARVVPVAWDDDFAEGRNFAIGRASGDLILWLNPDEELLPPWREQVQPLIVSGGDAFGYLARVQDVPRADRPDQFSESWDLRLFRRRPDLRYVGRSIRASPPSWHRPSRREDSRSALPKS